jgi:dTDP-glucose 4,6-dehydratase
MDECVSDSDYVPHEELIMFVKDRPGHDRRYAMNITKIRDELGWKPRFSLESGLVRTIEWYLEHPEWIDAIKKQTNYQEWIERNYEKR